MGPTGETRVVQIHPTRQCNLRCLHCYSSSSPAVREFLSPQLLQAAISDIADEGYEWVSFSGGEPTVYPALAGTLSHAKAVGLKTILVSNGMLLNESRLDALCPNVDLLVLSLDGTPESHNRLRNNPRAFELMSNRLEGLRQRNVAFGFIFTLTQYNLDELIWVVDFAQRQQARLVQIHPLENVGAASAHLAGSVPDAVEMAYAFAVKLQLQQRLGNALALQLDLIHSDALRQFPEHFYAGRGGVDRGAPLGAILTPLVIETDGTVVPVQYGFARCYAMGNLHEASLKSLAREWKANGLDRFENLCGETYRRATAGDRNGFLNWYELLGQVAAERSVLATDAACA